MPNRTAEMREIGVTVISREPVRIPTHVEVHVHYQHAYECRQCSDQLDHSVIKKAPYPMAVHNDQANPKPDSQQLAGRQNNGVYCGTSAKTELLEKCENMAPVRIGLG